ncbi:MAG TPA: hypothetical protein VMB50_13635, partial [Myxococcales bacterium]|nr:hypothetical protein [Myxococcales bacterium]
LVFGGVIAPEVGLLPLGFSAASIDDSSGTPSPTCLTYDPLNPTQADGQMALHLAPAHGGLEGLPYGVLVLAGLGEPQGAVSGLVQTFGDLPYGTPVMFGGQSFLGFTPGTTYAGGSRTFTLGSALPTAPTLYRLRFASSAGEWAIQIPPGTGPIVLPVPPSAYGDRTMTGTSVIAPTVEALQLQPSASSTALVSFVNGPMAFELLQEIQAFSTVGVTVQ